MKSVLAKWRDLKVRILSAAVLLGVGLMAVWMGQAVFALLIGAICGVMFWELQDMHGANNTILPIPLAGAFGGLTMVAALFDERSLTIWGIISALLAVLVIAMGNVERGRRTVLFYGAVLAFVGVFLQSVLRSTGFPYLLLMLGTVILTDISGYFFGRFLGGAKFWPSISPKKTWAGILGGWAMALLLGIVLYALGLLTPIAVPILVVMSFASQLGDIVESAMKRRAGVKDSSNLIPGHGGFLDRFDGVIGASVVLLAVVVIAA